LLELFTVDLSCFFHLVKVFNLALT